MSAPPDPRLPQTSNVAFPGHDGEMLRMALDLAGVACSVGSACSSGSTELSPTLRAMGLPNDLVTSSLRFSFGATTTEAEIDEAVRRIAHVCRELDGELRGTDKTASILPGLPREDTASFWHRHLTAVRSPC